MSHILAGIAIVVLSLGALTFLILAARESSKVEREHQSSNR